MKKYVALLLIISMFYLAGCSSNQNRQVYTVEYPVVSVCQYISTDTNNFGAVLNQELRYSFTYIGSDGQLYQIDEFRNTEHGVQRVSIGNENKYVIYGSYETLYLTEETFRNITTVN